MTTPTNNRREVLAAVLAEHAAGPRRLGTCACGERVGGPSTHRVHVAAALDAALAAQEGERGGAEVAAAVEALCDAVDAERRAAGLPLNGMIRRVRAALADATWLRERADRIETQS